MDASIFPRATTVTQPRRTHTPAPQQPTSPNDELSRPEHDVLAMLAIAHPDGLWEQDLRDILHMHSSPAEAADKLVARGLAVRHGQEPGHWKCTRFGLELAERV